MKQLFLADLDQMTDTEVRRHIIRQYEAGLSEVEAYDILVAYEEQEGYESSSFFLLQRRADGVFFENHASHCSCYGYEGRFTPEETTLEYLKSDKFSSGIYAYGRDKYDEQVKVFIAGFTEPGTPTPIAQPRRPARRRVVRIEGDD